MDVPSNGGPAPSAPSRRLRLGLFLAGISLATAALVWGMLQPFSPTPLSRPGGPFSLDWWSLPIERNAALRLGSSTGGENGYVMSAAQQPETNVLWGIGSKLLLKSPDDGRTWERVAARVSNVGTEFQRIAFVNKNVGLIVGDREGILITSDGGATWRERFLTEGSGDASPIWISQDRRVIRVTVDEHVYESLDLGETWNKIGEAGEGGLTFFSADGMVGFALKSMSIVDKEPRRVSRTSDGGRTWTVGTTNLLAETFLNGGYIDITRAWVPALDGVWETRDDGLTWNRILELDAGTFALASNADGSRILTSGLDGSIRETQNGGRTWSTEWPTTGITTWIDFRGDNVIASTELGAIMQRRGSGPWRFVSNGFGQRTSLVVESSGLNAFVANGVSLLWSQDSGRSWDSLPSRMELQSAWSSRNGAVLLAANINSNYSALTGIEEGNGRSRVSANRSHLKESSEVCLSDEPVVEGDQGWWPCTSGDFLSGDGGSTWTLRKIPERMPKNLYVRRPSSRATMDHAWFVGKGVWQCQRDSPCSKIIEPTPTLNEDQLRAFTVSASEMAFAVIGDRLYVTSLKAKQEWTAPRSLPTGRVFDVRFAANGKQGWAIGERGTLYITTDAGDTWEQRRIDTPSTIDSIRSSADGMIALALTANGSIVRSSNGGESWTLVTHAWYPAPWVYAVLAMSGLLLFLAFRKQEEVQIFSIQDVLAPDSPIANERGDRLRLTPTARGLARFIANERTEPPLTIAITGEWGTGKTSLMNLVRSAVGRHGFRTVWFNAWHHQTDEHVLSSLITALRADALPPWWRPDGLRIRMRLLWLRGVQHWLPMCAMVAIFGIALGHLLANGFDVSALAGVQSVTDVLGLLKAPSGDLVALVGAIAPLVAFARLMQGFGRRSFAKVAQSASLGDFKMPASVRQQFSEAFVDVTTALEPQRLVIFIDDLDRCQPQRVLAVLELVSFLASCGRCFIVVGMAWERVERCVGHALSALVDDLQDPDSTAPRNARERRRDFARHYMEKIVNIEVPVPEVAPTALSALFAPASQRSRPALETLRDLSATVKGWAAAAAIIVVAAISVSTGYFGSSNEETIATPPITQGGPGAGPGPVENPVVPAPSLGRSPSPTQQLTPSLPAPSGDVEFRPGYRPRAWWSGIVVLLASVALFGVYRFLIPQPWLEKDSPLFQAALQQWCPHVFAKTPTPRSVKRFVNRVRYFAMRQRPDVAGNGRNGRPQWLSRFLTHPHSDKADMPSDGHVAIPEDILVELAALHHTDPNGWGAHASDANSRLAPWKSRFAELSRGVHVN